MDYSIFFIKKSALKRLFSQILIPSRFCFKILEIFVFRNQLPVTQISFCDAAKFTRACIQNKDMGERVDSMSRLFLTEFINTVLKDWGQIHRHPFLGRWGGGGGAVQFFCIEFRSFRLYYSLPKE
jgi:hypothetical protein